MIVKSRTIESHLTDSSKTFRVLNKFNMYPNLTKYAFRVSLGKFLKFIVHRKGIDANLEKV